MGIDFEKPTPLYKQIAEDLKAKILSGQLEPGEQIGSHQALADKYDVSLITVKKALADLINEGILFSRVGKGTYVARKSAPVDLSKHRTIGLVLSDLKDPFFSLIVHGIEQKTSEKGYNLLLSSSARRLEKEDNQIRHFRRIGVDGMIIASMTHLYRATRTIRELHRDNFPYAVVSYMEDEDICFVGTDHEEGAYLATQHLAQLGYRRIGYINGEEGNLLGEVRKRGYRRALRQYDQPFNDDFVFRLPYKGGRHYYQSGYEIARRFLALTEKPEAIFAYNDLTALGFQRAIIELGLKVPDDVALVGFDDIERSQFAQVPLTTIRQPTDEIGALAVETIVDRINGRPVSPRTILKPKLIVRESCGWRHRVALPEEGA